LLDWLKKQIKKCKGEKDDEEKVEKAENNSKVENDGENSQKDKKVLIEMKQEETSKTDEESQTVKVGIELPPGDTTHLVTHVEKKNINNLRIPREIVRIDSGIKEENLTHSEAEKIEEVNHHETVVIMTEEHKEM